MASHRALIFHIYIPWGKTLSLVPKSRSPVKVKVKFIYQDHSFRKNGCCGSLVLHKRSFFYIENNVKVYLTRKFLGFGTQTSCRQTYSYFSIQYIFIEIVFERLKNILNIGIFFVKSVQRPFLGVCLGSVLYRHFLFQE